MPALGAFKYLTRNFVRVDFSGVFADRPLSSDERRLTIEAIEGMAFPWQRLVGATGCHGPPNAGQIFQVEVFVGKVPGDWIPRFPDDFVDFQMYHIGVASIQLVLNLYDGLITPTPAVDAVTAPERVAGAVTGPAVRVIGAGSTSPVTYSKQAPQQETLRGARFFRETVMHGIGHAAALLVGCADIFKLARLGIVLLPDTVDPAERLKILASLFQTSHRGFISFERWADDPREIMAEAFKELFADKNAKGGPRTAFYSPTTFLDEYVRFFPVGPLWSRFGEGRLPGYGQLSLATITGEKSKFLVVEALVTIDPCFERPKTPDHIIAYPCDTMTNFTQYLSCGIPKVPWVLDSVLEIDPPVVDKGLGPPKHAGDAPEDVLIKGNQIRQQFTVSPSSPDGGDTVIYDSGQVYGPLLFVETWSPFGIVGATYRIPKEIDQSSDVNSMWFYQVQGQMYANPPVFPYYIADGGDGLITDMPVPGKTPEVAGQYVPLMCQDVKWTVITPRTLLPLEVDQAPATSLDVASAKGGSVLRLESLAGGSGRTR